MDLRAKILAIKSKADCNSVLRWIGNNQQRFDELFNLFLGNEYRVTQLSAWPLSYAAISHPELIKKHFPKLVSNLQKPGIHVAVKRNTVRLLQFVEIPKKFHGDIMDTCFRFIASPTEAVAVKAFSLTILEKLSHQYPDIKNEIKLVIKERWDHETAAFHSRAGKMLKKL